MIRNLKAARVRVHVAPFEADHQIVRMFNKGKIKSVYSQDYGYFFYGIPIIKSFKRNYNITVIDIDEVYHKKVSAPGLSEYIMSQ
jgi:hypothetical protein